MTGRTIELKEHESRSPEKGSELEGLFLPSDDSVAELVEFLTRTGKLEILQLRNGLRIKTSSHVGAIRLGDVKIAIRPKIDGQPFMNLLGYAYEIRDLGLYSSFEFGAEKRSFQDLLIHRLYAEARELLHRGLAKKYLRHSQDLNTIRGGIDFRRLACRGDVGKPSIRCTFHTRMEDCVFNRLTKSGLKFAASLTGDMELRAGLRRVASILDEKVSDEKLSWNLVAQAEKAMNRLTSAYDSILKIVALLMDSAGISLNGESDLKLPGFLFDMNRFFQALVARFLRENLRDCTVWEEYRLKGMMSYAPSRNPRNRSAPTPRPDFAIAREGKAVSLLDAKYRDLWENSLPRDMLYQLAMYAMSQKDRRIATILYPAADKAAREAEIEIRDPIRGFGRAAVVLRPINLLGMNELISGPATARTERERQGLASVMAFGTERT